MQTEETNIVTHSQLNRIMEKFETKLSQVRGDISELRRELFELTDILQSLAASDQEGLGGAIDFDGTPGSARPVGDSL